MSITMIAAVAENGVIGSAGAIPWRISRELKHFRETTMGGAVILGRKTADAVGALTGRLVIAVSRDPFYTPSHPEILRAGSIGDAITIARERNKENIFIAGGGQVYADALCCDYCDSALISRIPGEYAGDSWFPEGDLRRRMCVQLTQTRNMGFFWVERWDRQS